MNDLSTRHFTRVTWLLAPLVPLLWMAVSLSGFGHDSGMLYSGMLQGDQPTYTAMARAVFWHGNGLVYSNPFDSDPAAPRVLCNLGYVLLGWLMRPFAQPWLAWEIWRIGWGTLCFGLWGMLVARVIARPGMRWWTWGAGATGGGMAWVIMHFVTPDKIDAGFWDRYAQVESGYGWWCLNLFRQGAYPLELFYHALLFGAALAWLDRRRGLLALIVFMTWWAHVITALLATSLVTVLLIADYARERRREDRLALGGIFAISGAFMLYYRVYLHSFPSIRSWIEQTMLFQDVLTLQDWLPAFGPVGFAALLALCCAWLRPAARRALRADRGFWLIAALGMVTFVWMNNQWFLLRPIQPLHFARGYMYLALILGAARGYQAIAATAARPKRAVVCAAALCMLPLAMDNVLFVARVVETPPQPGMAQLYPVQQEAIGWIQANPSPWAIYSNDQDLGRLLLYRTPARVYTSEPVLTPFFSKKMGYATGGLRSDDPANLLDLGIGQLLISKALSSVRPSWITDPAQFRMLAENDVYIFGEILGK